MRTCYLHIGTHKTGTTSIQNVLNGSREALGRRGFLFPQSGLLSSRGGHSELSRALIEADAVSDCALLNALLEEIASTTKDVVISCEGLQFVVHHQEKFRSFVDALRQHIPRIVIIVYLRDQADYARSLYVELLTSGCRDSLDDFLSAVLRDRYYASDDNRIFSFGYERFLEQLPSGSETDIIARHYDSAKRTGVVADFLGILGLTRGDLGLEEEPRENVSATATEVFLPFYRRRLGADACPEWLVTALYGVLHKYRVDLSPAARRQIVATFDKSNRAINARFPGFALPTLDDVIPDILRDDCLAIDQVLSDITVQLVAALKEAREYVAGERDSFARLHAEVASYRDFIEAEYAKTSASMKSEYERTVQQYRAMERQRDEVASERDRLIEERNRIAGERDLVAADHVALAADRDRIVAAYESSLRNTAARLESSVRAAKDLERERDLLLTSRSWRFTAPLRAIVACAKRWTAAAG